MDSNGKTTIAFEAFATTVKQAEDKAKKGVTQVFEAGVGYSGDGSEIINFVSDGKYNVNNGETMDIELLIFEFLPL